MSLLMEALKKAEEAKRQADQGAVTVPPEMTLAPLAARSATNGSPLPDLSLHADALDADLAAMSAQSTASRPQARHSAARSAPDAEPPEAAEREAARNVFAAKQAAHESRSSLPLILTVGGVAMLVLGGYFWWQLQALSGNSLAPVGAAGLPTVSRPAPAVIAENTPLDPENAGKAAAMAAPAVPPGNPASPPPPASESPLQPTRPMASANASRANTPTTAVFSERPASRPARTPATEPSPATTPADRLLRITRNQPKPNQTITTAYDALLAGQFDLAQQGYEQVLRRDAKSTDALLGMATIAANRGETDQAYRYYLAALESNPTNATAQAGLISTGGQTDPGLAESRLKTALAAQPGAAALHFALGNLYARQTRWGEAQQAFFNAYSIEPDNADFIFNQAVSLDHLHKSALAAQYYRMALTAADGNGVDNDGVYNTPRPVAFDRQQVRSRLLELQP